MFLRYLVPVVLAVLLVQAHPIDENHHSRAEMRAPLAIDKVDQRIHPSAPKPLNSLITPSLGSMRKKQLVFKERRVLPLQDRRERDQQDDSVVGRGMQDVEVVGLGMQGVGVRMGKSDRHKREMDEELEARGLRPKSDKPKEQSPGKSLPVDANTEQDGMHLEVVKLGSRKMQGHNRKRNIKTPDYKNSQGSHPPASDHDSSADRSTGDGDVKMQ